MEKYILRLAIDIGSTVSAIGWQLFERQSDEKTVPVADTLWVRSFPTKIIESSRNPQLKLARDLFADDAEQYMTAAAKQNLEVTVTSAFKAGLYNPNASDHRQSCQATTLFLSYLRDYFSKATTFSQEQMAETRFELWLTVPVVAAVSGRQILTPLAKQAGFTPQNRFAEDAIHIVDESRCLADFAFEQTGGRLLKNLHLMRVHPEMYELVLLVDVGGLTADISLVKIRFDPKKDYSLEELASWPTQALPLAQLGGGISLDMALYEYLREKEFVHPEAAERNIQRIGYDEYRRFKENANNEYWRKGETPDMLGTIGMNLNAFEFPPRNYQQTPGEQLSPERFLNEVAADYVAGLTDAVREVIANARQTPQAKDLNVSEEAIDWVFLTGGGSNMFFMKKWLLGEVAGKASPLRLNKIKEDPLRIVGGNALPTQSAVRGTLAYTGRLILHAKTDYWILVTFMSHEKILNSKKIPLASKDDVFPHRNVHGEYSFTYQYSGWQFTGISCLVQLQRGESEQPVYSSQYGLANATAKKNIGAYARDVAKEAWSKKTKVIPSLLPFLAIAAAEGVKGLLRSTLGIELPIDTNTAKNAALSYKMNLNLPSGPANLNRNEKARITYRFDIDENGALSGSISFSSPSIKTTEASSTFQL